MIRRAETEEYEKVLDFYYRLIDDIPKMEFDPLWEKGIYPNPNEIRNAVEHSELFIYEEANEVLAAMRVNHEPSDGYEKITWGASAAADEVTVLHMLGVAQAHQKEGIAKRMVQYVIDTARINHQKAIRLDVLADNTPAKGLYNSVGFEYRDKIKLYYDNTGVMAFELYELIL